MTQLGELPYAGIDPVPGVGSASAIRASIRPVSISSTFPAAT
jgi:hypothetical protein